MKLKMVVHIDNFRQRRY